MGSAEAGALRTASTANLRVAAISDTGPSRENNEDAFLLAPELGLFAVSDGMGGHAGGETASRLVVESLPEILGDRLCSGSPTTSDREELFRSGLRELSGFVRDTGAGRPGLAGMGATVVAASVWADRATVAHLGDSRAYLHRAETLLPLTRDHSIVAILLAEGEITEAEVATDPARGLITHYAGMPEDLDPDVTTIDLEPGDRLLLCTDGLTGAVADGQIAEILTTTAGDAASGCELLMAAALDHADDNVTVLVADLIDGERLPGSDEEGNR